MRIRVDRQPKLIEVPRTAWAPWLAPGVRRFDLLEDFTVQVDDVLYVVPAGYRTDKASIPKWLHWLFPPGYAPALCASILHDYCYSHLYRTMTKAHADDMFRAVMLSQGASTTVACLFYRAVSTFGKGGWA